jgi:hypothetical protein
MNSPPGEKNAATPGGTPKGGSFDELPHNAAPAPHGKEFNSERSDSVVDRFTVAECEAEAAKCGYALARQLAPLIFKAAAMYGIKLTGEVKDLLRLAIGSGALTAIKAMAGVCVPKKFSETNVGRMSTILVQLEERHGTGPITSENWPL